MTPGARVAAPALRRFAEQVFIGAGMSGANAATVAEVLLWANLRGVDSHGVQRIPRYLELIDDGSMNPRPALAIRSETPAAVTIEADRAPGPVAMRFAAPEALRKARQAGIGFALVRRTTHTAALGHYTRIIAEAGMGAIGAAASIPNMVYHGAAQVSLSTSAYSLAVPGPDAPPLVLDMATSFASLGRMTQMQRTGQKLPAGWALDAAGAPTTDPAQAELPLPLGGPKGSGLALMAECFASLIGANPIIAQALSGEGDGARHRQNSYLIAIDIGQFCDLDGYRANLGALVAALKALPRQPGIDEILMPGERGERSYLERSRDGIPIPPATWTELRRVAARFGLRLPG